MSEVSESWIQKTPRVCGGDACIRKTRIPVWALVEARRPGFSDEELLTRYDPPLSQADLDAAWRYFEQHSDEIEQAIRENKEVMEENEEVRLLWPSFRENFDQRVVEELRRLGHDVLTAKDAGRAGQGIPDHDVLAFAISQNRAVITFDRKHFIRLHKQNPTHCGIIVCTDDKISRLLQ